MRDTEEILKADKQDTSMEWDWVMTKWPTSHNTKSKKRSKVKNEAIWKAAAAPHSAPCASESCRHKQMVEKREWSRTSWMDWRSRTSWWVDSEKTDLGKEYFGEADTTGHNPDATKTESENSCHRSPLKRDGNRLGRTGELRCLATLFLLLSSWLPWSPSFCRTESEDSSDFEFNEFIPATDCVWLIPSCFLCLMYFHMVINCVQVHTLPTAQVPSAFADYFSWCHEPFTHACKARPPTVVGWTSLSVIFIVLGGRSQRPRVPTVVGDFSGGLYWAHGGGKVFQVLCCVQPFVSAGYLLRRKCVILNRVRGGKLQMATRVSRIWSSVNLAPYLTQVASAEVVVTVLRRRPAFLLRETFRALAPWLRRDLPKFRTICGASAPGRHRAARWIPSRRCVLWPYLSHAVRCVWNSNERRSRNHKAAVEEAGWGSRAPLMLSKRRGHGILWRRSSASSPKPQSLWVSTSRPSKFRAPAVLVTDQSFGAQVAFAWIAGRNARTLAWWRRATRLESGNVSKCFQGSQDLQTTFGFGGAGTGLGSWRGRRNTCAWVDVALAGDRGPRRSHFLSPSCAVVVFHCGEGAMRQGRRHTGTWSWSTRSQTPRRWEEPSRGAAAGHSGKGGNEVRRIV